MNTLVASPSGSPLDPSLAASGDAEPRRRGSQAWLDTLFRGITRFFALVVFSLLAAILASLVASSTVTLEKFGLGFLANAAWDPVKIGRAHV